MALNREKIHQSVQRLVLKGQLDKAIQELRPILDEDPNDTRTLQKVAELFRKKGSYQESESIYTRLAEALMRGGFYQRAVAVHNQILQLNPTNLPVHIALGDTLNKLGLVQEANKVYARTVGLLQRAGRFDEATAILEKLIAAAPDNYQARLQLAELYLKAGRSDAAIKAFEDALPTLRAQGRDDLFQRAAERLLYYQPENLALCRELSVFHLRRGNVPQAMKLLQYCHKRDPQDVDTLRLLASHFEGTGDADKAVVVLHQMAQVFDGRGDKTSAEETYRRILEIRPRDAQAAKALGAGEPLAPPPPPPASPPPSPASPPSRRPLPPPGPRHAAPAAASRRADKFADVEAEAEVTSERVGADEIEEVSSAVMTEAAAVAAAAAKSAPAAPVAKLGPVAVPEPVDQTAPTAAPAAPKAAPRVVLPPAGPELPPLPEEPSEVQKIAAEADIFVKFGLKDRAIGHLTGGLAQFAQSIVLRDRLIAIHLNDENLSAAVRVMLEAARSLLTAHRDHAQRYLREVLFLDEENQVAKELLAAFGSGATAPEPGGSAARAEPAPESASAPPPAGTFEDLDVDIDVAAEPVRTFVVPPPPTAAEIVPIAPSEATAPAAESAAAASAGREPVVPAPVPEPAAAPASASAGEHEPGIPPRAPPRASLTAPSRPSAAPMAVPVPRPTSDSFPSLPSVPPVPPPTSPTSFPPPPSPGRGPAAGPERAQVVDLPSFDEVETGPPFLVPSAAAPGAERLVIPLSESAAAPLVIEMDEEDFGDDLPVGELPEEEFPEAPLEGSSGELTTTDELPTDELPTDELPTDEHLPPEPSAPAMAAEPPPPVAPAPVVEAAPAVRTRSPAADAAILQTLEEVDFFVQQGLTEDARTLLDGLAEEYGPDARIQAKQAHLAAVEAQDAEALPIPPPDAVSAIESAFDALESAGSGAHAIPSAGDDEALMTLAPADATMHFDLGVAYREMGVLDRAVDEFRLALQDPSREANCYAMIGACLIGLGKPKDAVDSLKQGLHARNKTDVDELELYYGLAEAYLAAEDAKEALFYLQKIKRKDPEFRDVAHKINALLSAGRPGRRPAPRPSPAASVPEDSEANIDEAFDDMFKGERH